jgi:site-specific recombinase XerD
VVAIGGARSSAASRSLRVSAGASHRISSVTRNAVEMARKGVPLTVIQRQLGHANLGVTSIYLQGIDNSEIINTVFARPAPMLPASAGLR